MKFALAVGLLLLGTYAFAQTEPERQGATPGPQRPAPPENIGKPIGDPQAGFAQLDANSDGRIGRREAKASIELDAVFARFDADSDGALSREEYEAYGRDPRKTPSP